MHRSHRIKSRTGFTLIELMISMGTASILIVGLGSAIYLSGRALDDGASSPVDAALAADVLNDVLADLQHAQNFSERTATAVTFAVPDRDGDQTPDTIRYAWTGVVGDPLTYEYNNAAPVAVAHNVQDLNFTFLERFMLAPPPPATDPGGIKYEGFAEALLTRNGKSLTVPTPAGTVAGDLLIAAVATDGNTLNSLSPPPGWNLVVVEQRWDAVTLGVWWRLATTSEPPSHKFTWSSPEEAYGWIMRFSGHDPASPINAWAVLTTGSGQTNNPPSPSVTTTVNNALILRLGGFDDDDINVGDPGLPGHTAITMNESDNGNGSASGGAGYLVQPNAGPSGQSTFTLTDQEQTVAVTIAIAPKP